MENNTHAFEKAQHYSIHQKEEAFRVYVNGSFKQNLSFINELIYMNDVGTIDFVERLIENNICKVDINSLTYAQKQYILNKCQSVTWNYFNNIYSGNIKPYHMSGNNLIDLFSKSIPTFICGYVNKLHEQNAIYYKNKMIKFINHSILPSKDKLYLLHKVNDAYFREIIL